MSELITCTCKETYYTYNNHPIWEGWEEWLQCSNCGLYFKHLLQKKVDIMRDKLFPEEPLSSLRQLWCVL